MIIKVDTESIENGIAHSPHACPVAIAIKKQLGLDKDDYVSVGYITVAINKYNQMLPRSVKQFTKRFDKGEDVHPFNFRLKFEQN